jgi:hypothetical protein
MGNPVPPEGVGLHVAAYLRDEDGNELEDDWRASDKVSCPKWAAQKIRLVA